MDSRLSRNLEQRTKRKLYLTILGIILVLFLVLKYGIPALVNLSLFLSSSKDSSLSTSSNNNNYVASPVLDSTFSATNSASISVSGTASLKEQVKLFANNKFIDTTDTNSDGKFQFKNVPLEQGDNVLKAKSKSGKNESDYSNSITVTYKNSPPALSIENPSDGQSFSKDQSSITVSGKTEPDITVTVNNFVAIIDDKGNYSYNLHLQNGDNQLKVIATDPAGNKTEKDIKVTYSQ